ncbi:GNAT family N-acetyltransferase [Streptomyces spectabilis]|uniref:GNAT family N-acetyltransferase n=1 Tax=Streptomyces spectabilis TaxID=68270 RepID=UPI0039A58B37
MSGAFLRTPPHRAALAAGAREVLLFTDLADPDGNGVYQRVGYRPVRDVAQRAFTADG